MGQSLTLQEQYKFLEVKANYLEQVANDAANNKYWNLAKYCRNEKLIALAEMRGLTTAMLNLKK